MYFKFFICKMIIKNSSYLKEEVKRVTMCKHLEQCKAHNHTQKALTVLFHVISIGNNYFKS